MCMPGSRISTSESDLDVARGHFAFAFCLDVNRFGRFAVDLGDQAFDVQDDFRHILFDARDRRELVLHAVDLDRSRRNTGKRGEQHPS